MHNIFKNKSVSYVVKGSSMGYGENSEFVKPLVQLSFYKQQFTCKMKFLPKL